jgi:DNA-binding transcriptional regulator YiaG
LNELAQCVGPKNVKTDLTADEKKRRAAARALQEWEQGGRQPDSAARAYLTVIAKAPAVMRRALDSE